MRRSRRCSDSGSIVRVVVVVRCEVDGSLVFPWVLITMMCALYGKAVRYVQRVERCVNMLVNDLRKRSVRSWAWKGDVVERVSNDVWM